MQISKVVGDAKTGDDADVKREKSILIRVTAEQHEKWQAAATAAKRTVSDWIRIVIDEHLEGTAPTLKPKRGR